MTVLVLLHAFPLSADMWYAVRPALSSSADLVTPHLPGFGGRPVPPGEPSVDAYADDVARHLDDLGHDRVVLGGLSMGGYVAMAFLRRHADRVTGLLLADTKASADPEPARQNRERIAATVLAEGTPRVLHDDVLPSLVGDTTRSARPEVLARVRELVNRSDPAGVAWAQRAMAARPDSTQTLRHVREPALVVVGDEDKLTPEADAAAMVEALPDARLVILPGAGHLSAVEVPSGFADAVGAFVASLRT